MAEFLEMGGYGGFIWPAYAAVGFVLAAIWIASKRFVSNTEDELAKLSPARSGEKNEA